MTINVGLVTSDALVLGCDSVASTTQYFLDPLAMPWDRGTDGTPAKDADGRLTMKFRIGDFQQVVTNAWGGVTKIDPSQPVTRCRGSGWTRKTWR